MTSKILCATDGEPHSDLPITLAAQRAIRLGVKLVIIAVNTIVFSEARGGSYNLWTDEKLKEVVERAAATAKKAGVPDAETVEAFGTDPAAVIVDYADKNGFDHVVVGSPRVGIARLVLGSVAAEVATKAHCAVTVSH